MTWPYSACLASMLICDDGSLFCRLIAVLIRHGGSWDGGDRRGSSSCVSPAPSRSTPPTGHQDILPRLYTHLTREQTAFCEAVDLHSCPFRQTNCDSASDLNRPPVISRPVPALHFLMEQETWIGWFNAWFNQVEWCKIESESREHLLLFWIDLC